MDLERFLVAQNPVYLQVLRELNAGRKTTHWMWFIFPQHVGLGRSEMAKRYGLSGLDHAQAYAAHPVLGARLHECTQALLKHKGKTALQILGTPDDLKLHSCMTLFNEALQGDCVFRTALVQFFQSQPDEATLRLIGREPSRLAPG